MLVTDHTERVDFTHEPGQYAVIRMLSWSELEEAQSARTKRALAKLDADDIAKMQSFSTDDVKPTKEQTAALADMYDERTLLTLGVVSWSYDEEPSSKTVEMLDNTTKDLLVERIKRLSKRTTDEGEG